MADRIIILGTAPCLEEDLDALACLDPDGMTRAFLGEGTYHFCAVGLDCADRYLGRIEHAVSYHPREFPQFRDRREKVGGNLDYVSHTHNDPAHFADRTWPYFSPSGSSTMLGVEMAIGLGYQKIIVAGCLLEGKGYVRFRLGWVARIDKIKDTVRALSGYPSELLGAPTEAWLNDCE